MYLSSIYKYVWNHAEHVGFTKNERKINSSGGRKGFIYLGVGGVRALAFRHV